MRLSKEENIVIPLGSLMPLRLGHGVLIYLKTHWEGYIYPREVSSNSKKAKYIYRLKGKWCTSHGGWESIAQSY